MKSVSVSSDEKRRSAQLSQRHSIKRNDVVVPRFAVERL